MDLMTDKDTDKNADTNSVSQNLIHKLLEDWSEAMRAKDAEAASRLLAPQDVEFSLAPPLQNKLTPEEFALQLRAWFATFKGSLGFEVRDLRIVAGDTAAFSHGLCHLSGMKHSGEVIDVWFRKTVGFCKHGDDWKIAHEHDSVPFYMDGSDRAATDLNPQGYKYNSHFRSRI